MSRNNMIEAQTDVRLQAGRSPERTPRCGLCKRVCIPHPTGACRSCRKGKPEGWTAVAEVAKGK